MRVAAQKCGPPALGISEEMRKADKESRNGA